MYSQIASNKRKSVLILLCFMAITGLLAWLFSLYANQPSLTIIVLGFAVAYALFGYFSGGKMSLALNGAHEIQKHDNPRYYRIVENLAITDGLPMPKVYVIDDPSPNAFATGRDPRHAAVCATSGLLDIMNDNELEGVIAHELGHVKNYDIRVAMLAFALTAVISVIADVILRMVWYRDNRQSNQVFLILGIVAAILAPLMATLIQLAVSRQREYLADATGALTTRYPEGLASALEKIEQTGSALKRQNASTAHFFFANPLRGKSVSGLFSTHPPIEDRIARLRKMGRQA